MPDYTFYVEDYLGEDIPEKEFPRFIRRAGDELRRMREMYAVAPRQGLDPELAESMALCAVADAMYEFAQEDEARGIAKRERDLHRAARAVLPHAGRQGGAFPPRGGLLSADRAVAAP